MKKIIAFAAAVVLFIACSKDDNNSTNDPIFSQPYTELQDLSELTTGKYQYVGNKLGDRKVGLVGEGTYCKQLDNIIVTEEFSETTGKMEKIIYYSNFRLDKVDNVQKCISIFQFPRIMTDFNLVEPGKLRTKIYDEFTEEEYKKDENGDILWDEEGQPIPVIKKETRDVYRGYIEIGFQAGYLRMEDRISDYNRVTKDEKVYLYFKKM